VGGEASGGWWIDFFEFVIEAFLSNKSNATLKNDFLSER
jgi:hypothetical protein